MLLKEEKQDFPKPIGDFIFAQTDIKPFVTNNGYYYHYSNVCTLLNRNSQRAQRLEEALGEIIQIGKDWDWGEDFWAVKIATTALNQYRNNLK